MNRKGITLLEVLMAIFIMGIGMVSVFALFPVAALMMGQSIEKYQINEVVNNAQSNFDTDALEFIRNQPNWVFSAGVRLNSVAGTFLNSAGMVSSNPQYLFLDQAAGPSRTSLGGVPVAYINDGVSPTALINERYFVSNNDIELDESGRAVAPVSSVGRYSVSFLLEKKIPFDNPLPSRRYMLVFKGRSQTFPDFTSSLAVLSSVNPVNSITVSNVAFCESCKRNDWVMILNNLGERTFHQIQNINGNELEFRQRFGAPVTSGIAVIQGVYLLLDVVRVVDMGAG